MPSWSRSYQGIANQEFLPDEISETKFFEPGENAREKEMRQFLKNRWNDKYGY